MTSRILRSIFVTALVLMSIVCIAVVGASYKIVRGGMERELEAECRRLAAGYGAYGIQYIEMYADVDRVLLLNFDAGCFRRGFLYDSVSDDYVQV